ncbi:MAG: DUF1553 domain-containing protein [Zavarzinella sp.]
MSKLNATLFTLLGLISFGSFPTVHAQPNNDSGSPKSQPILHWTFDDPKEKGVPANFPRGAGPRLPVYPNYPATNMAGEFGKQPIVLEDSALPDQQLRFSNGDSITMECWVKVQSLPQNSYAYLIGKGRTLQKGFPTINQNYALRLHQTPQHTAISFLFSSAPTKETPAQWHRWTSDQGFGTSGWHHVAITYTFGKPKTIKGFIDGQVVRGKWDMAGETAAPPVEDGDKLMLGTGNGGGAGNTFKGWLDDVMVWREAVPDAVLKERFQMQPPVPILKPQDIPDGKVLVHLCEDGMPTRNAWPDEQLKPNEKYETTHFGFSGYPQKYTSTGVRADRANPFLFRAASMIQLPPGNHRLLLRGRGAARLYVDGKLVMSNPFPKEDSSGHGTIKLPDSYLNLGPDFRFAPPGNSESWMELQSTGKKQLFVLETIVGGYVGKLNRRPEMGETVVAISFEGTDRWQLLTPTEQEISYNDAGWHEYDRGQQQMLMEMDAAARAKLRTQFAEEWKARREAARQWLESTPEPAIPKLLAGYPANNAIDHFLALKIVTVKNQQQQVVAGNVDFYRSIAPILQQKCYGCHAGSNAKGGLRLDSLKHAMHGGNDEGAAISPGKPETSALLSRVNSNDSSLVMPPKGEKLSPKEIELITAWIKQGATWPDLDVNRFELTDLTDDLTFLRRLSLDTVGVVPTLAEIAEFQADHQPNKRQRWIEKRLSDPRWADQWMGYWLDVLAENPNILNPTLNNTGPFRWWIYESLLDNKPMDLFVTELIRMEGSERFGGPAGFGIASQNDVPMAAKAMIVANAFMGVQMKCARCHDAPGHRSTQEELFQLAALLQTKPIKLPASSSVPLDAFHGLQRKPLIQVTLKPGTTVAPAWPFTTIFEAPALDAEKNALPREYLARWLTAPQNERFAQVMANRIWQRFMGRGIVETVDDWEKSQPSHPELLQWLGREFVRSGYDTKHIARLIFNSHAYQRQIDPALTKPSPLFTAPARVRLQAEQIVDSLFHAAGKSFPTEEVSLDIDGRRDVRNSISLGVPTRSWMLTSTSNERDRPSLALPRVQAVADVLTAFGWRGARQDPITIRDADTNVIQPAILANGTMMTWLTRLSDDHQITQMAIEAKSAEDFVEALHQRLFTRSATAAERAQLGEYLQDGFTSRMVATPASQAQVRKPKPFVSWSNHLHPDATTLKLQEEGEARRGDPPTNKLTAPWREKLEDVLWTMLMSPEMIYRP